MSAAGSHPTFLAGFVGGALAAATYTLIAVAIYRATRRHGVRRSSRRFP